MNLYKINSSRIISWLWIALALLGILTLMTACGSSSSGNGSLPSEISVEQAHEKYDAGVFFLDVRTPEEWDAVHIPNTTLIPLDELSSRTNELPKDQEIVVVCRSGNRSQQGRDILKSAGFEQVTSMSGGVTQWSANGYPTTSGP